MARRALLNIENRAKGRARWPDWFIHPVCDWIMRRAGLDDGISRTIIFRAANPQRPNFWRGSCWREQHLVSVTLHRRMTSFAKKDPRFKWSPTVDIASRLEMFVYLVSHELRHWMPGNVRRFEQRHAGGRRNIAGGEFDANSYGEEMAHAFRDEWPGIRAGIMTDLRRKRERTRKAAERAAARKAAAGTPEAKLVQMEAALSRWQRKRRLADTYIAKYKRRIRALRAAITRGSMTQLPPAATRQ